ncbi:MAG: hypothetical protein IKI36_03600 [Prevotella sp.]|nr:hypothetical protein [Prevotella sp.]
MKKFYVIPEARYVDINLVNSVLEDAKQDDISLPGNNFEGDWEERYDKLPNNKSVWGTEEMEDEKQ